MNQLLGTTDEKERTEKIYVIEYTRFQTYKKKIYKEVTKNTGKLIHK